MTRPAVLTSDMMNNTCFIYNPWVTSKLEVFVLLTNWRDLILDSICVNELTIKIINIFSCKAKHKYTKMSDISFKISNTYDNFPDLRYMLLRIGH